MKRRLVIFAAIAGLLTILFWAFAQPAAGGRAALARLVPPGPLLYLEARDFSTLLRDWNSSQEKRAWLAGDDYQVFSRSRLFLKLQQAQKEFEAAAGAPPNMDLLSNVAGGQSALAMYDIGALEFLYITTMPADRFAAGALWKLRGNYQPRQSSGFDYYVRTDPATHRVAAFATARDYVLVATREDIMAGGLSLLAGQSNAGSVEAEPWFAKSTAEAKTPGELRMVMNFEKLPRSPHFRSYWVQQNITEMKQYSGAVADAARASGELREDRVLIRANEAAPSWNEAAVGSIVRFAPATAGIYRAWASPSSAEAFDLIRQRILDPRPSSRIPSTAAPQVSLGDGVTGSEADLETRIDEPALDLQSQPLGVEFRKLLDAVKVEAMLVAGSARPQQDGVFVAADAGVALIGAENWDGKAVRDALAAGVARLVTTDQIGAQWVERRSSAGVYYELDGLTPLTVASNNTVLLIATRREVIESMLAGLNAGPGTPARYAALYRHSRELPGFEKMMHAIDGPLTRQSTPPGAQEPAFFSGNLASLGRALSRVDSESIHVHDTGAIVTQSLVYKFR